MSPRHLQYALDDRGWHRREEHWQAFLLDLAFSLPARHPEHGLEG